LPITHNCLFAHQIKNISIFLHFLYHINIFYYYSNKKNSLQNKRIKTVFGKPLAMSE
jgi:hypothetical protein